jgi:hypothetical protein
VDSLDGDARLEGLQPSKICSTSDVCRSPL